MTNLKRSLISLFFAVGLASATNSAGASQHEGAAVVAQHAPAFVPQAPSFDSPAKKFNHAVVSAAPVPGAFVTPTLFAHSMPTLAPSTGRSQQPLAGGAPARMQSNRGSRPNGNAPATTAIKSTQRAPVANSAGVAKHPAGKNLAAAALAAAAIIAVDADAAAAAKEVDMAAGMVVDTVVTKVDADAADAVAVGAATTVADLAASAATIVATTVAHAAATTRSRAATTAAAAAVVVDVVARVEMADTVDMVVGTAGINA
ncbi:hypothetical protein GGH13_005166 [Coemansia sp. S155-1]|nr:hypothetical protein GGH13_005166 [Coemansia sp. S155-1]